MLQHDRQARTGNWLVTLFLVGLFSTPTCWPEDSKDQPGNPRAGQELFIKKGCMRCHSLWERGEKKGPSLASVGQGRNLYELCASIWSHWSQMNAVREQGKELEIVLASSEIRDIVAYLYYLNYSRGPGDPAQGEKIFKDRNCVQCHALEPMDADQKPGPPIYHLKDFRGPSTLAVAVWNHGGEMLQAMAKKGVPWPVVQDQEIAHLVQYIRSHNGDVPRVQNTLPGNASKGRALFLDKSCANCHQVTAGGTKAGPNLAASGPATSLSSMVAHLWNHYPKMSQVMASKGVTARRVTNDEMDDLMSYVYWVRANGLPGNAASGRDLYQTRQCATCHSVAGEKAGPVPALIGSETTGSPYAMLAAIWNHGPKMQQRLREKNITWPALSGEEMRDLVAFFQADPQHPPR